MSEVQPTNHKEIIQLIKRISGQANFIGTPRIFVDLFEGDLVAAVWFNQAVYWDGKNTNPVGFYKTAEEWKKEIGLSIFQIRRAARISQEMGLINISFKKVYGTPKNHYLVVWPELLRVLTDLLDKSDIAQSEGSQSKRSKGKDLDLPQSETSEGKESETSKDIAQSEGSLINQEITSENHEEEEDISLPEIEVSPRALLDNLGLVFASKTFGKISIRKPYLEKSGSFVLGWITKAHLDRERLKSPIAFIASRLNGEALPDLYYIENYREILPREYLESLELASYSCPDCKEVFRRWQDFDSHWMTSHGEEDIEETFSAPEIVDPEAGRAWETVIEQLQAEMPRASFESWVSPTRGIIIEEDILRVWAPTVYAREWLDSRIASTADRLLVGILSRSVSVEFFTGSGNGSAS